jgi:hypothetical protein
MTMFGAIARTETPPPHFLNITQVLMVRQHYFYDARNACDTGLIQFFCKFVRSW